MTVPIKPGPIETPPKSTPPPARSPEWGKTVVARLTCLYKAEAFEDVVKEVEKNLSDPRCKDYLPQLTYVDWVASRRLNKRGRAVELQKSFLERFPSHPLAAEMRFALAVAALMAGEYKQATEELDIIEHQFPSSSLIPKVKELKLKLTTPSYSGGENE